MFTLKPISREAHGAALEKAERYRLLNEPREAESICRDVLAGDAANHAARVTLVLSLTDQLDHEDRAGDAFQEAKAEVAKLEDPYAQAYYEGVLHERQAKARLQRDGLAAGSAVYVSLRIAMECFERAEAIRPPGNDDSILRWNTCARILMNNPALTPAESPRDSTLDFGEMALE